MNVLRTICFRNSWEHTSNLNKIDFSALDDEGGTLPGVVSCPRKLDLTDWNFEGLRAGNLADIIWFAREGK